jgi:hypothetical protein
MFKIRFWPITARPITAISALGSMFVKAGDSPGRKELSQPKVRREKNLRNVK